MTATLYRGHRDRDLTNWATNDHEVAEEYAADYDGEVFEVDGGREAPADWFTGRGFEFSCIEEYAHRDIIAALKSDGYDSARVPMGDMTPGGTDHTSWVVVR